MRRSRILLAVCLFLGAGTAIGGLRQGSGGPVDVLSRVFTVATPDSVMNEVLSREFTVRAGVDDSSNPTEVLSREFTVTTERGPVDDPVFAEVLSREFTVSVPLPDLAVVDIDGPTAGLSGQSFVLSWTVQNVGAGDALGSWTDRITITDEGDGQVVSTQDVAFTGPLPAGQSAVLTQTLPFPASPGTYRISIATDADGALLEDGEANNALSDDVAFPVALAPQPNLVVDSVVTPANTTSSADLTVTYTVRNVGQTATQVPAWQDSVFLVRDTGGAPALPNDLPTGQQLPNVKLLASFANQSVLAAGEDYTQNLQVTLPADEQGDFYLAVHADARPTLSPFQLGQTFDVDESDELDNVTFTAMTFQVALEPQPDLVATGVTPSGGLTQQAGKAITVVWTDENQGQGSTDTGSWTDEVYLSANNSTSSVVGDTLLGQRVRTGLPLQSGQTEAANLGVLLPPELAAGDYFLKVQVDVPSPTNANGVVSEVGGESNNIAVSSSVQVQGSFPPDLQVGNVTATPIDFGTALAGHTIQVDWEVTNGQGGGDYGFTWTDRIRLSTAPMLGQGTEYVLGSFPASATSQNGTFVISGYPKSRTLSIPDQVPAGTYYVIVETDAFGQVYEGGGVAEGGEAATTAFQVDVQPVDLVPMVDFSPQYPFPTAGAAGTTLPIPWQVTNQGAVVTPESQWSDRVWFSSDAVIDAGDQVVLTVQHSGALQENDSYVEDDETFQVPNAAAGDHFLILETDAFDQVFELPPGEGNNQIARPFTVTPDRADLVLDTVTATPATPVSGSVVQVGWTGRNQGSLATVAVWTDEVFLSDDAVLDAGDVSLGQRTHVGVVAPGGTYSETLDVTIPLLTSGMKYVLVQADVDGQVFESMEANNTVQTRVMIDVTQAPPADLVAQNVVAPATATSGQPLPVTWEVANVGAGATNVGSWKDGVYLSLDPNLDPQTDLLLGTKKRSGLLMPGEIAVQSGSFTIPLGVAGPYFVLVEADLEDDVYEGSGDQDNTAGTATFTQIALPQPADLEPTLVTMPSTVLRGDLLTVDWDVTNQSATTSVAGSWVDNVFLSLDATWDASDPLLDAFPVGPVNLAPGDTASFQGTAVVSGVTPDDYHVIVRTDVFDQIPETDELNDTVVSAGTVAVTATPLPLGVAFAGTLDVGEELYFELDLSANAGQTIELTLDHDSPSAWTELYVRRGLVPTPGQFDFAFDAPATPSQRIVIPTAAADRYFVLARRPQDPQPTGDGVTILAQDLPFGLDDVLPKAFGAGVVTARASGAQFDAQSAFALRELATGQEILPTAVLVVDATEARATFDLSGVTLGDYEFVARDGADEKTLPVVVEAPTALLLDAELTPPASLREGTPDTGVLVVENVANVDVPIARVALATALAPEVRYTLPGLLDPNSGTALEAVDVGGYLSTSYVVPGLAPGERATDVVEIKVAPGYSPASLGFVVRVEGFDLDEFRDGPFFQISEATRLGVLGDPSSPQALVDLANDPIAWHMTVNAYYDANIESTLGLAPPGPGPAAEGVAGSLACGFTCALICSGASGGLGTLGCAAVCTAASEICSTVEDQVVDCFTTPGCDFCLDPFVSSGGPLGPCVPVIASVDPNEKNGPGGFGAQAWVPKEKNLQYSIYFENLPTATGPAARVTITDDLAAAWNLGSFELGDIEVGDLVIDVPDGSFFFQDRIDLQATQGVLLDVTAGISLDPTTGQGRAFWVFQSLDPLTLAPPTSGFTGFLPPEDGSGRGQGRVQYSLGAGGNTLTGSVVANKADIVFDSNAPITTNQTQNVVDGDEPGTAVDPLPPVVITTQIPLTWSGGDPAGGSGFAFYRILVSEDGGTYVPLLETDQTSTTFTGKNGSQYAFYSVGVDRAGNEEPAPTDANGAVVPDATVLIDFDCNQNGMPDSQDVLLGTSLDCNLNGVPDECEGLASLYCTAKVNSQGCTPQIGMSGTPSLSDPNPFVLDAQMVLNQQTGLLFFGVNGRDSTPFLGGLLCVAPRIRRTAQMPTGGNVGPDDCSGALAFDLNAYLQSGQAPFIGVGTQVNAQFWYRDPAQPDGTGSGLTDAAEFVVCP